ncbi:hypothetical protein BC827DRAFT_1386744 [Russula dissimulans]|nr:hypothetical protein BC827DRAFT_1386744 [Russula dissimulans]
MVQFTNVLMALLAASATSALPLQKRIAQTITDSTQLPGTPLGGSNVARDGPSDAVNFTPLNVPDLPLDGTSPNSTADTCTLTVDNTVLQVPCPDSDLESTPGERRLSNSSNVARDGPSGAVNFTPLNAPDVPLNGTSPNSTADTCTLTVDNTVLQVPCPDSDLESTPGERRLSNSSNVARDGPSDAVNFTPLNVPDVPLNGTSPNSTADTCTLTVDNTVLQVPCPDSDLESTLATNTSLLGRTIASLNSTNSNTTSPSSLTDLLANTTDPSDPSSGSPYDSTSYLSTDSDPSRARSPTDSFVPGSAFRRRAAQQKETPAKDLKVNESKSKSKNGKDKSKDGKAKAENEKAKAKGGKAKSKQSKATKP